MMKKQYLKKSALFILSVSCACLLLSAYYFFWHPNFLTNKPAKRLCIPQDTTFPALQAKLQQEGYITYVMPFRILARLMRYDRRVMAGAYNISTNMGNLAAIRLLRSGMQQPVKVTLTQARTKQELAEQLTRPLALDAKQLLQLLENDARIAKYGFNQDNILAMFIPNTYELYWTVSASALFERMYREYKVFWNNRRLTQAQSIPLTPIEVATLASIMQCETNKIEEAPLIAGVYINRLHKKIALGSDPTLLYILNDPSIKRVLKKHRDLKSPYNTYKNRGLPPGPICMPSIAMTDAVLNFTKHRYFYFSAKEDFSGYHYFANSFKQHLRNARRYQKALNQAKIYR